MIDFLGIGAQKSATTWVYKHLSRHPRIHFPATAAGKWAPKEVHFWDRQYERGVAWWISLFPDRHDGVLQGECTPDYCCLPHERIAELYAACPRAKFFAILRNPIARSWSAAKMFVTPEGKSEREILAAYLAHIESDYCRRMSDYEGWLRLWRSIVPARQLCWFLFDDVIREPRGVLCRLANYLEVDDVVYRSAPLTELTVLTFRGPARKLPGEVAARLRELHFPQIASLSDYLECDLRHWKDAAPG